MICIMDRAGSGCCDRLFEAVPMFCAFYMNAKSGGMGIRTPDIQLAKLALYQLSYTPIIDGCSHGCGWGGRRKIE